MGDMKRIIILLSIILALVGAFFGYKYYMSHKDADVENADDLACIKKADCIIYYYGDLIELPSGFEYEKITELNFETMDFDHDSVFLIVNELTAADYLSINQVSELVDLADRRSNFNFIYLGKESLSLFHEKIPTFLFDDDDLSFSYVMEEGNRLQVTGILLQDYMQYAEKNKMLIADNVISFIAKLVRKTM